VSLKSLIPEITLDHMARRKVRENREKDQVKEKVEKQAGEKEAVGVKKVTQKGDSDFNMTNGDGGLK
jgi:hypothetical protein